MAGERDGAPRVSIRVERGPHPGVVRGSIARRAASMLDVLQLKNAEVSIVLTNDAQIRKLNKAYRGKDKATDVLAFAQREGDFGSLAGDLLGDVIVSVPTARRQATRAKRPVLDEVTMLLAHGILHLLGWDHETAAKDRRMRAETDRLCLAAAAGDPVRARPGVGTRGKAAQRKDTPRALTPFRTARKASPSVR